MLSSQTPPPGIHTPCLSLIRYQYKILFLALTSGSVTKCIKAEYITISYHCSLYTIYCLVSWVPCQGLFFILKHYHFVLLLSLLLLLLLLLVLLLFAVLYDI